MKPKIVKGHEIWMEYKGCHGHLNEKMNVSVKYGHNMRVDGTADIKKLKVFAVDSEGIRQEVELNKCEEEVIASFIPEKNEPYTLLAEYDAGIYTVTEDGKWYHGSKRNYKDVKDSGYYLLYAKIIVPVGHGCAVEEYNLAIGNELEIIPELKHFHVGDEITLKVLYEDKPLEAEINATFNSHNGKDYAIKEKTDSKGKARIKLNKGGNWMFLVRHEDPDKGTGDYDKKVITAILTIMNVH